MIAAFAIMCWTHDCWWRQCWSVTSYRKLALQTASAPLVWGTTYAVTTQLLPAGQPMWAALLRSLPGGLLAVAVARQVPVGVWWWRSLVLGGLNIGFFFPLLFISAEHLPGGVAATLGSIQPLAVAGFAALILGERTGRWRLGCAIVGSAGVAVVVLTPAAQLDAAGVLAGLAGAVSMALGVVLSKKWGRPQHVSALGYAGWLLTAAGLILLLPTLLVEGLPRHVGAPAVLGYLWLALPGGVIAYTVWFRGIRSLPATPASLLGLLSPLMAATLGVLVVHDSPTPWQVLGFALAVGSVAAAHLDPPASEEAA